MRRFIIHTEKYEVKLRDFAESAAEAEIVYINRICKKRNGCVIGFTITGYEEFCELLLPLLLDIAEGENPVYGQSAKLREMARDLRKTQIYGKELRRLKHFISGNKGLHIEGYVTFRMGEFREKLDMLIYSLVKKIKFSNE